MTADGKVYTAGDVKSEVSIQSISKVFTMAKVIEEQGPEAIEKTIGVDATGMRFNSIVSVEFSQKALGGPEMNSLVNPGAIATTTMVKGGTRRRGLEEHPRLTPTSPAGRSTVNQEVFKSEADDQPAQPGHRRADVRLRLHQGEPGRRRPTSTPSSAR